MSFHIAGMHLSFLFLFCFLQTLYALPPTTNGAIPILSHNGAPISTPSLQHSTSEHKLTTSHSLIIFPTHTTVSPHWPIPTRIPPPRPEPQPRPEPVPSAAPHNASTSPVAIVFEALGGFVGLVIIISLMRCLNSYRKTPHHDRVAGFLSRYRLQREMEERERNPGLFRQTSLREPPPPPYIPHPPAYNEVVHSPDSSRSSSPSG